ncbi:spondin domain-containing protein [Agaribacter flavus]|uniref:Spondin domain-containing protein n=1 Tax=Agaribacter flavus TaxID=1902781 RepID=A0ABV7FUW1_9ALTE
MNVLTSRVRSRSVLSGLVIAVLFSISTFANATMLRVTVTNNAQANGLAFTPLYTAFHGASFDAFDVGGTASAGLEALAELGQAMPIAGERLTVDPSSLGGVIFPDAGMRPLFGGESGSLDINITDPASNMFFTFLSMILPSNDTFFGRDDAIQLFDAAGNYLGDRVIAVTGADLWDAGTEALDVDAAPFIPGNTATDSPADTSTSIRAAESLAAFAGLTLANGRVLDASLIDFLSNPDAFDVATITIEEITAEVSAPSAIALFALAIAGIAVRRKA